MYAISNKGSLILYISKSSMNLLQSQHKENVANVTDLVALVPFSTTIRCLHVIRVGIQGYLRNVLSCNHFWNHTNLRFKNK